MSNILSTIFGVVVGVNSTGFKMWIQVRSMDGKKSCRVDGLSKLTKVEELRKKLVEHFETDVESQRLFYRGKQV